MGMTFGDFYRGRRVLVTGDTGFKGSWLCQWLLELGAEVHGLALPPPTDPSLHVALRLSERIRHRDVDIRDSGAVNAAVAAARPDVVFHLAAQPLVRASYQDPKTTFDTNVGGTVNVLEAVRKLAGPVVCVVVSSDKCYENREWEWGYREVDGMGGHDPYSASKGAAELVVASYRRSFAGSDPQRGMRLASARAGNVIGGGDWARDRIVPDFIAQMQAGQALSLRNPNATRPWQHVLEPLSGYLLLAQRLAGDASADYADGWNFGPADASIITVHDLATRLVRAWGSGTVTIDPVAPKVHEASLLKLDCSKALSRLKWRGTWDVDQTIVRTIDWYRAFHAGQDVLPITRRQIGDYVADAQHIGLPWTDGMRERAHG